MRLIDPSEHGDYLAILHRNGYTADDFDLRQTDTTEPKGDEVIGLKGMIALTRRATGVSKDYAWGDEGDWLAYFGQDLEAGEFDKPG
ncbi:transcriptional regulator [Burkholderia alba]|uniref:transcriptional regulator n=1 Tax=Burkholderia alba TaxID=2683677 RepID=UPI002B05EF0C|nr:transcriptional regulator [Burkholderia alba]